MPTKVEPSKENNTNIVQFSSVAKKSDFGTQKDLAQLDGKEIQINAIDFFEGKIGTVSVVTVADGERYYTFSRIVKEQLESVMDIVKANKIVVATVRKKQGKKYGYRTLE